MAAKTVPRGSKIPQERPKTRPRRPKTPPGGLLGRSSSHLGSKKSKDRNQERSRRSRVNWWKLFGSILEPKIGPKTTPRRPPNESKIKTKNASLFYRSWTRLGPVLRRSWARLGVRKVVFALVLQWFRENRRFRKKDDSRRILVPT